GGLEKSLGRGAELYFKSFMRRKCSISFTFSHSADGSLVDAKPLLCNTLYHSDFFFICLHSLAPVFALFVPFYCSIPRVQVAHILGPLSITNKTLIYILGLQVSGICYNSRMLQVHEVLYVPSWMAKFCAWTLEPLFSSSEPTSEARVGMGATVDIQRQQRMELLDRQLMLSQFAQVRRQRQQQSVFIACGLESDVRCDVPGRQWRARSQNFHRVGRRGPLISGPGLQVKEREAQPVFSRSKRGEPLRKWMEE
ncbi:hypothetical protein FD755_015442, partial [Muntiacus reevesi]